jgi:sulfatase maturation enzyme AslB (radical SAM superfamily)
LVCIQVSLNGTKEIDAKIRGNDAAFDKTVEGIKLLRKHNVQTWIHTVIMNDNIHDLDNIIKNWQRIGCEHNKLSVCTSYVRKR